MTKAALTLSEVEELARLCLQANGCDEANAGAVAATVTAADRRRARRLALPRPVPHAGLCRLPAQR
jgi:LDH2 family malate/lactate/ureidoglycolate dehydrogenase